MTVVRSYTIAAALAVVLLVTPLAASAAVAVEDFGDTSASSTDGYRGAGLEVVIPAGAHWGLGRFQPVPGAADEAWFRYMLILDEWSPSQSGKLPGLASLRSSSARGCVPPSRARPGWSARMMYQPVGEAGVPTGMSRIGYYVYHLDQPKDCGEGMEWNDAGVLAPGEWDCIEGHVRLNTPGQADGGIHGWVNGAEAFSRDNLRFRDSSAIGVDDLWLNVFSGGKPTSPERLELRLDEIVVSTSSRVGCPDAFDDDIGDPNEAALNRLADLGAMNGCGPHRACPDSAVSRGEFVSMLAVTADLSGGEDAFADDEGHPAEAAIDAAAAAGVTSGCGAGSFCPDAPITRGADAVMIATAFDLPRDHGPSFDDIGDAAQSEAVGALVAARVAGGCGSGLFCPDAPLKRSHAAAMLANVVSQDRVVREATGRQSRPSLDEVMARTPNPSGGDG